MGTKTRSAPTNQATSVEQQLALSPQTFRKRLKKQPHLENMSSPQDENPNRQDLVRPPLDNLKTTGQRCNVQGLRHSQRQINVCKPTAQGKQGLRPGATNLPIGTGRSFTNINTRRRPGEGDGNQSHQQDTHSQAALIDVARRTGVTDYTSFLRHGVLTDLTEVFTDSMESGRRQTLLEEIEQHEQGLQFTFQDSILIKFPMDLPMPYPWKAMENNIVSLYNERVDPRYPRMMCGRGVGVHGKWYVIYQNDDIDMHADSRAGLDLCSPTFKLLSNLNDNVQWPDATFKIFEELATFFDLYIFSEDTFSTQIYHPEYNLQDYQRVASATVHFEDALMELGNKKSGHEPGPGEKSSINLDGNWSNNPNLQNYERPEIFDIINATNSIDELEQLTVSEAGWTLYYIMSADNGELRSISLEVWERFSDPAEGIKMIKWNAAFITAARKISMANYQRFTPDLQGLKLFVFTGICGGAGVTPSPGMARWWSEIVTLWPH